jgi:hypothetical protein
LDCDVDISCCFAMVQALDSLFRSAGDLDCGFCLYVDKNDHIGQK